MKVSIRQIADVTILDLGGRLVAGETELFRSSMRDLIARGETNIILNLRDVPYIDSAGIGELVRVLNTVRRHSGDLRLLCPSEKVCDVLNTVKLFTIFQIFWNESEALAEFGSLRNDAMKMDARAG